MAIAVTHSDHRNEATKTHFGLIPSHLPIVGRSRFGLVTFFSDGYVNLEIRICDHIYND